MNIKALLTILALIISAGAFSQSVGINSDGSTPNSSAILDISSVNQGLLIPFITLHSFGSDWSYRPLFTCSSIFSGNSG